MLCDTLWQKREAYLTKNRYRVLIKALKHWNIQSAWSVFFIYEIPRKKFTTWQPDLFLLSVYVISCFNVFLCLINCKIRSANKKNSPFIKGYINEISKIKNIQLQKKTLLCVINIPLLTYIFMKTVIFNWYSALFNIQNQ